MLLEFRERMIIVEEWWSFAQKGDCEWITHILSTEACISTQEWQEAKTEGDKEHGRSNTGEEDMLRCVQGVRAVRGMRRGLSDHLVILCKVRLVGTWIKKREVVAVARRIRNERLKEHQYKEEYASSLVDKGAERDGDNNIEHM